MIDRKLASDRIIRKYRHVAPRPPPRILLAEDDDVFRRLVAASLRADGLEVVEVRNGRELVNQVAASVQSGEGFDLVISDIRMPSMTGLDALAGLRCADWATPVILMTAFGDSETHAEALRLGAGALFAKPFDLRALRAMTLHLVGA